jgi:hypothetical protein
LLVTRSATGVFSAYVNSNLALSFLDSTGLATFSGSDNAIYFFMDDFESLHNFPTLPEAGSGFVDFIQVTTPAAAVPGPLAGAGLSGLILGWWWPSRLVATARENESTNQGAWTQEIRDYPRHQS